jgi:predicted transcriptional regulator
MQQDIRTRRKVLGLSQSRLALRSGVGRFKIAMLELGERNLTSEELSLVEKALSREAAEIQVAISHIGAAQVDAMA